MSIFSTITDKTVDWGIRLAGFSVMLLGLYAIGSAVNEFVKFNFLTTFFVLVRRFLGVFDFAFDTSTMIWLFTIILSIQLGVWVYHTYLYVLGWFIPDVKVNTLTAQDGSGRTKNLKDW